MKNLEELDDLIFRYTEGSLTEEEMKTFRQLMEKDPEIRDRVALDQELTRFLQDKDLLRFRGFIEKNKPGPAGCCSRKWMLMAALLLVLVAVGTWVAIGPPRDYVPTPFLRFSQPQPSAPSGSSGFRKPIFSRQTSSGFPGIQSDTGFAEPVLLAGAFAPLPWMEGLVGEATRYSGIRLISPEFSISVTRGDTIRFSWNDGDYGMIDLVFTDNKGQTVWKKSHLEGKTYLVIADAFSPGLYYWKLLLDEELGFVGKVKVVR